MSFAIVTAKKHMSYDTPEQLLEDYKRIIHAIHDSPVIEFDISESRDCLEFFKEQFINVPIPRKSRRVVYFGKQAHFLVYNIALSGEFPIFED